MRSFVFVALVPLVACQPEPGLVQMDPLEAAGATHDSGDDREAASVGGAAAVSGDDRDWSLQIAEAEGEVTVDLHLPGGSDLSHLDGRELSVDLGAAWGGAARDTVVADASGPVLVVQPWMAGPTDDLFGAGFVSFGEAVGDGVLTDSLGEWTVRWHTARFQTDDGAVELKIGEPAEITVDGQTWRVVVHGAMEVLETPDPLPSCGGGYGDTLSFEMLRVEREISLEKRAAKLGSAMAGAHSCG